MTVIDLKPSWNEYSNEWEVCESDERGNTLEVYNFNTEDEALAFVNDWLEKKTLTPWGILGIRASDLFCHSE